MQAPGLLAIQIHAFIINSEFSDLRSSEIVLRAKYFVTVLASSITLTLFNSEMTSIGQFFGCVCAAIEVLPNPVNYEFKVAADDYITVAHLTPN